MWDQRAFSFSSRFDGPVAGLATVGKGERRWQSREAKTKACDERNVTEKHMAIKPDAVVYPSWVFMATLVLVVPMAKKSQPKPDRTAEEDASVEEWHSEHPPRQYSSESSSSGEDDEEDQLEPHTMS